MRLLFWFSPIMHSVFNQLNPISHKRYQGERIHFRRDFCKLEQSKVRLEARPNLSCFNYVLLWLMLNWFEQMTSPLVLAALSRREREREREDLAVLYLPSPTCVIALRKASIHTGAYERNYSYIVHTAAKIKSCVFLRTGGKKRARLMKCSFHFKFNLAIAVK